MADWGIENCQLNIGDCLGLEQGARSLVQKKRRVRLPPQDGGRASNGDWPEQGIPYRDCLPRLGNQTKESFRREQRRNRQRQGVGWNRGQAAEVTFAHLLPFARVIEFHNLDPALLLEIRDGWIVESEMPVFADAETTEVDRLGAE